MNRSAEVTAGSRVQRLLGAASLGKLLRWVPRQSPGFYVTVLMSDGPISGCKAHSHYPHAFHTRDRSSCGRSWHVPKKFEQNSYATGRPTLNTDIQSV